MIHSRALLVATKGSSLQIAKDLHMKSTTVKSHGNNELGVIVAHDQPRHTDIYILVKVPLTLVHYGKYCTRAWSRG